MGIQMLTTVPVYKTTHRNGKKSFWGWIIIMC